MKSTDLKHLKRWIVASYLQQIRKELEQGFSLFLEGEDRTTETSPNRIELRVDGPYIKQCTKSEAQAYIEVNLLGNSTRNEANVFDRYNLQGIMSKILNKDFCIYRIGNVNKIEEDDSSLVGVMALLASEMVKISDFGLIDNNTEIYQSVAEGHYEMYF